MNTMKYFTTGFSMVLFFSILISCSNQEPSTIESIEHEEKSVFMTNDEIENLIGNHQTLFLSYWVGMTKSELNEVTRYLLEKEIIRGIVFDPYDDSSSFYCGDYSWDVDKSKKCEYREFNKNNYHLLIQESSKKLLVLIDHTLFEIEFNFSELDGEQSLSSIKLSALSNITTDSVIDYRRYEPIVSIYKEKYGKPIEEYINAPNSGNCSFINGTTRINLNFWTGNSNGNIVVPENFTAVSYIEIDYIDIDRESKILNYKKNKSELNKRNNEIERQKLEEKTHSETFNKI